MVPRRSSSLHPPASPSATASTVTEILACQPMRMLVRIARQSHLGDPAGCEAILALIATGRAVRSHLQLVLGRSGLSEIKFSTLLTLYALDPDPSTPAELAQQSRVSRAAMSDTIESLYGGGWVGRERSVTDRRTAHIRLTARGRALVERAVRPFLSALGRCAGALTPAGRRSLTRTCSQLIARFHAPSPSKPNPSHHVIEIPVPRRLRRAPARRL